MVDGEKDGRSECSVTSNTYSHKVVMHKQKGRLKKRNRYIVKPDREDRQGM